MKRIALIAATLLITGQTFAKAHGPAGCGLGALLLEGKEGLVMNVIGATLNGTSGNQTFGMSTGTLGCEDAAKAKVASVSFIEANRLALSNDIARGEGETLDAYLTLIEAPKADKVALKSNYASIFVKGVSAQEIENNIREII
jgi:hypothetical protein